MDHRLNSLLTFSKNVPITEKYSVGVEYNIGDYINDYEPMPIEDLATKELFRTMEKNILENIITNLDCNNAVICTIEDEAENINIRDYLLNLPFNKILVSEKIFYSNSDIWDFNSHLGMNTNFDDIIKKVGTIGTKELYICYFDMPNIIVNFNEINYNIHTQLINIGKGNDVFNIRLDAEYGYTKSNKIITKVFDNSNVSDYLVYKRNQTITNIIKD